MQHLSFALAGAIPLLNHKSRQNKEDTGMIPFSDGLFVFALYILANIAVFCLYAYDKHMARNEGWRIPERILLAAALIGPFGAYGAMRLFRHKTQKIKFYLVPFFLLLHIAGILYIAACLFNSIS
jgi:uncharacterized membrane protein YsdA (DUF1294 family)